MSTLFNFVLFSLFLFRFIPIWPSVIYSALFLSIQYDSTSFTSNQLHSTSFLFQFFSMYTFSCFTNLVYSINFNLHFLFFIVCLYLHYFILFHFHPIFFYFNLHFSDSFNSVPFFLLFRCVVTYPILFYFSVLYSCPFHWTFFCSFSLWSIQFYLNCNYSFLIYEFLSGISNPIISVQFYSMQLNSI